MSRVLIGFTQLGLLIWEMSSYHFSSEAGAHAVFLPRFLPPFTVRKALHKPFLRGELEQPLEGKVQGYPPAAVEENEALSLSLGCRMLTWGGCPGLL